MVEPPNPESEHGRNGGHDPRDRKSTDSFPASICLDDTNAYWVDDDFSSDAPMRVARCAKAGCGGTPTRVTPDDLFFPSSLAVDAQNVFWTEYQQNAVGRASKVNGAAAGYIATFLTGSNAVAVDDASVFFGTSDTVGRIAKGVPGVASNTVDAAVAFTTLANAGYLDVFGLAIDSTNVYWAEDNYNGPISYLPKAGLDAGVILDGGAYVIAPAEQYPLHVAVDDVNIYWTAQGPDTAHEQGLPDVPERLRGEVPEDGVPPTGPIQLASGHNPHGLAIDDVAIYVTVRGTRTTASAIPVEMQPIKIAK